MITLMELKKMVEPACGKKLMPTARYLMDSGIPVVVKEALGHETDITVYGNGYVVYRSGKYATVFRLHNCKEYTYDSRMDKKGKCIEESFFDHEPWYIRLMLEGEDRLVHNQNAKVENWTVSYSCVAEDWDVLCAEDNELRDLLDEVAEEEFLSMLLPLLTVNQKEVFEHMYRYDMTQAEIAKKLGISQQAVSEMLRAAKKRLIKKMDTTFWTAIRRAGTL